MFAGWMLAYDQKVMPSSESPWWAWYCHAPERPLITTHCDPSSSHVACQDWSSLMGMCEMYGSQSK
eukprot:scaffold13227_cov117-Isochrysis_galbana.AAC.10